MSTAVVVIAGVAIIAYTVVTQILGTPLRAKRLIVLPGILTVVGVVNLAGRSVHPSATDIAIIAAGAAVASAAGLTLGGMMRLQERDGSLWGQLPRRGLWLWAIFLLSRGALVGVAHAAHAHVAAGTHAELLILGINRLGQAAVVGFRAWSSQIPFAPESDGSRPFGGLFAARSAFDARPDSATDRTVPRPPTSDSREDRYPDRSPAPRSRRQARRERRGR